MTNREDGYMTSHCTQWSTYDVPTIWSTLSDEGDAVSYAQVTAWRETSEAIDRHAATLKAARDTLATGWPPTQSEAAQEFLDQVDSVLATMAFHSEVAARNSTALLGILRSLETARDQISPLYEEWSTKSTQQRNRSTINKVIDTATFWSNESAWQDDLKKRSTQIMVTSDMEVAEHRQQMQAPVGFTVGPEYSQPPKNLTSPSNLRNVRSSTSNTLTAPDINGLGAPSNNPPNVVLTSAVTNQGLTPSSTNSVANINQTSQTNPTDGVLYPIIGQSGLNSIVRDPALQPTESPDTNRIGPFDEPEGTALRNANRGGIIGKPTSDDQLIGFGNTGLTRAGDRPAQRPTGVIGSTQPVNEQYYAGGQNDTGYGRSLFRGTTSPFDPDTPWEVATGVPAVVEAPTKEAWHSPGVGVIGIDR